MPFVFNAHDLKLFIQLVYPDQGGIGSEKLGMREQNSLAGMPVHYRPPCAHIHIHTL